MSKPDYEIQIVYAQGMVGGLSDVIEFLYQQDYNVNKWNLIRHLNKKIIKIQNTINEHWEMEFNNQQVTAESAAQGGE